MLKIPSEFRASMHRSAEKRRAPRVLYLDHLWRKPGVFTTAQTGTVGEHLLLKSRGWDFWAVTCLGSLLDKPRFAAGVLGDLLHDADRFLIHERDRVNGDLAIRRRVLNADRFDHGGIETAIGEEVDRVRLELESVSQGF